MARSPGDGPANEEHQAGERQPRRAERFDLEMFVLPCMARLIPNAQHQFTFHQVCLPFFFQLGRLNLPCFLLGVCKHQHRPGHENLVSTLDCRLDDTWWCCPCLFKRAALNVGFRCFVKDRLSCAPFGVSEGLIVRRKDKEVA